MPSPPPSVYLTKTNPSIHLDCNANKDTVASTPQITKGQRRTHIHSERWHHWQQQTRAVENIWPGNRLFDHLGVSCSLCTYTSTSTEWDIQLPNNLHSSLRLWYSTPPHTNHTHPDPGPDHGALQKRQLLVLEVNRVNGIIEYLEKRAYINLWSI